MPEGILVYARWGMVRDCWRKEGKAVPWSGLATTNRRVSSGHAMGRAGARAVNATRRNTQ